MIPLDFNSIINIIWHYTMDLLYKIWLIWLLFTFLSQQQQKILSETIIEFTDIYIYSTSILRHNARMSRFKFYSIPS